MDAGKVKLDLRPCKHCGRTFVPESLAKHQPTCLKVQKKRKAFDPAKQRVTEDLSLRQIKQAQKKEVKPTKSNWREKHMDLVNNIRAARGAQIAMERGDPLPPPPPPSINPDYVQCPYCSRRFNEKAAERHINFCKEQQKRVNPKREPTHQERQRANANKYQPPKPKARGGPAGAVESPPVGGGGSYSKTRGGYSGASSGARGTPPGAAERSRAPAAAGGGYSTGASSRGRGPAGAPATRGRPAPTSTYQGRYAR